MRPQVCVIPEVRQKGWAHHGTLTMKRRAVRSFSRSRVVGMRSFSTPVAVLSRFTNAACRRMWRKMLFWMRSGML